MGVLTDSDIVIGTLLGPFGSRGEVKVKVLTDFPDRFALGKTLNIVLPNGERKELLLQSFRVHKNINVAIFEGITDRNAAESLRGSDLVVDKAEIEPLPEDSFYLHEIVGCSVFTDDGRDLGVIKEILQPGSNDVYITSSGVCVPALKQVVVSVDVEEKRVVIHPMQGMFTD